MFLSIGMLKLNYFLADIFILSAEKQPIKLSWRKIECLRYRTIIIRPLITKHLSDKMSETFWYNYIYSFLKEIKLCNTFSLTYLYDDRFQNEDFFIISSY